MTDRGNEMHELGNSIVALQFCLRRLEGCQHTDELEGLVRGGLEVCAQAIVAFRKVHEYHAVADQTQSPTARATYRRLAESCEGIVTAVRGTASGDPKGRVAEARRALRYERQAK